MDGDRAPLPEILTLAQDYDAWTLVDDAHGLGVVEPGPGAAGDGTLSKTLGSTAAISAPRGPSSTS